MQIQRLTADQLVLQAAPFARLLCDVVQSGASVGFLQPLGEDEALRYWMTVRQAVEASERVLLGAWHGEDLVGTVQLGLAPLPNGRHRAEVMKLLVGSPWQRQGIGRQLMHAIHREARGEGRTLLMLDTETGGHAELLYRSLGYVLLGTVPRYFIAHSRELMPTSYYYRELPVDEETA